MPLKILFATVPPRTNQSSIWFLLFDIKLVLVINLTTFYLTDLFILYFFIQNAYADKKELKERLKTYVLWVKL